MLDKVSQEQLDLAATEGYDDRMEGDAADMSATRVFRRVMGHNRWQDFENWDEVFNEYLEGYEFAAKEARAKVGQKFTKLRIDADLADGTLVTFYLPDRSIRSMGGNREYAQNFINAFADAVAHMNKGEIND